MSEKRYPATPEQLKALSIMWVKKHRDVRFQFRVTEKEAILIRRGFAMDTTTRACLVEGKRIKNYWGGMTKNRIFILYFFLVTLIGSGCPSFSGI